MVAMRDGVRMATDVYRPARDGRPLADPPPRPPPPHALQQDGDRGHARPVPLVRRPRLRGRQPGLPRLLPLRRRRELPGARGRGRRRHHRVDPSPGVVRTATVGSFGTSWSGWTQTAMAALGPEGLATMVANMSGADAHESSVRHGGALELRFLAWAFWHSAYNTQAALTAPRPSSPPRSTSAPRRSRTGSSGCPSGPARPSSPWCRPTRSGRSRSSPAPTTTTTGSTRASTPARTGIASRRCPSSSWAAGTTRTRAPPSRTSSAWAPAGGGRCAS